MYFEDFFLGLGIFHFLKSQVNKIYIVIDCIEKKKKKIAKRKSTDENYYLHSLFSTSKFKI